MVRAVGQAGVVDPLDIGMVGQELRHFPRVLAVPLHAQVERLEALEEEESVEGRKGRPCVAQQLDARLQNVRLIPEGSLRTSPW